MTLFSVFAILFPKAVAGAAFRYLRALCRLLSVVDELIAEPPLRDYLASASAETSAINRKTDSGGMSLPFRLPTVIRAEEPIFLGLKRFERLEARLMPYRCSLRAY